MFLQHSLHGSLRFSNTRNGCRSLYGERRGREDWNARGTTRYTNTLFRAIGKMFNVSDCLSIIFTRTAAQDLRRLLSVYARPTFLSHRTRSQIVSILRNTHTRAHRASLFTFVHHRVPVNHAHVLPIGDKSHPRTEGRLSCVPFITLAFNSARCFNAANYQFSGRFPGKLVQATAR